MNLISRPITEVDIVCLRLRPRNYDIGQVRSAEGESVKPYTLRKSFNEQTPQRRLASMPMISCNLMIWGVPRARKAAAGFSTLPGCWLVSYMLARRITHAFLMIAASSVSLNFPSGPRFKLQEKTASTPRSNGLRVTYLPKVQ